MTVTQGGIFWGRGVTQAVWGIEPTAEYVLQAIGLFGESCLRH